MGTTMLWACLVRHPQDQHDEIAVAHLNGRLRPLVTVSEVEVESLRSYARQAAESGQRLRLVRYREDSNEDF